MIFMNERDQHHVNITQCVVAVACFPVCKLVGIKTRNCNAVLSSEAPAKQRTAFLID